MGIRQRLSSKWVTVLLVVAVAWLLSQAAGVWLRVHKVRGEAERMADRAAEIERDIARRTELLEKIQDPEWLAYQARLRLNYKLADEHAVVVYKKENSGIINAVASGSTEGQQRPIWQRLRDWLAGVVQW